MELIANTLASVAVGVALWAVLPRGVVLTRSFPASTADGHILLDTWRVQNDSPLSIRIASVAARGPSTVNRQTGDIEWVELKPDDEKLRGAALHLDDEVAEIRRLDRPIAWSKEIIPPGDTLKAYVMNNTDLRIRYRRAGWLGVFERRTLTISGGA
ncbi:hypothetical protein ABTX24_22270 [Nocardioides sp. NPDC127514]|uniref:hypothetical protein n=1 Tax=unclassified Nocardioides TaxID=2615069 RepID=UPI0033269079